ncbi:type I methionyl aminopeptidase [Candidatus Campbellbacteria bacterium CG11_big_fil_rev_8_21_14_0_20_44_21]|uniref:Methionine aminopeptidase n=1 Tax=Candidatus Campbellbacteria bacterium CG22_combo_CG10-13_8_21_14_all_43_18 TaxID=1974530 RepID=A0A2H0DWJ5_9BACT|nr:MAG: type I methionyl aminopeptidase [Candidatus Campbellbacteria bacterium CG22_combo_CG10-13_8_21_14_all_43_18]PIR24351.1 MAG: type I methionyl aminopeptidase [Candidatus Campbellbacteria bacterium CG11_big_fil_rev_8_21_14_0_20_44_21]
MIVKTKREIELLREGGRRLSAILHLVAKEVRPGMRVSRLNQMAMDIVKENGDVSAFLGYEAEGFKKPFPAALCVSVNDEVVHGLPRGNVLKEGDIVTLDMGLVHEKLFTDAAITVPVGKIDQKTRELIFSAQKSLELAIEKARPGNAVGQIGFVIEQYVRSKGFIPAEDLGGHGLGLSVHEEPYVPNIGPKDRGPKLKPGMVIAIEPIINEGSKRIYLDSDGFTLKTADGKRSAHFEHTVLITDDNPVILTES